MARTPQASLRVPTKPARRAKRSALPAFFLVAW